MTRNFVKSEKYSYSPWVESLHFEFLWSKGGHCQSEGLNFIPVLKIEGGGSIEQSPCILILNLVWVYRKLVSMSLIDEVASRKD